ncbi:glycine betaine ABC transporter permease protein [Paenibacillus sp. TCA20]|nr:glycine betaine ABC transporter permease protein [Paenibacillus sp. TCA20]
MPKLPIAEWIDAIVDWLNVSIAGFFRLISTVIESVVGFFSGLFMLPHPILFIIIIGVLAYLLGKWKLTLFTVLGFLLIYNLGYWPQSMDTLGLVVTSGIISIVIGVPLGFFLHTAAL